MLVMQTIIDPIDKNEAKLGPNVLIQSSKDSQERTDTRKKGRRAKRPRVDMKAKLEKSRQSARECRARKKLRYQYLEDLVNRRERAVISLREEAQLYLTWATKVDQGADPNEVFNELIENRDPKKEPSI